MTNSADASLRKVTPDLKLLDLTLKNASAIQHSLMGEFTSTGSQEILVARPGGAIEVHKIESSDDDDEDEESRVWLKMVMRVETRSVIRSIEIVRLSGEKRDLVIIGSDSGNVSVMDFEGGKSKILHCPAFGKTGCRRGTPGQYLAKDPKGRAFMISAIEKRKLVYVLNRDASGRPTIASPLEAHRSRTIVLDTVGVDNGYDNPIFASLEYQYPDEEDIMDGMVAQKEPQVQKEVAYYELDLGLNHVSRRWAISAHVSACCLAPLHGGADGPSGVLVGGEDWIEYIHEGVSKKFVCAIPRRNLHPPSKGVLITKMTVHKQKKSKFFALAQSELGDVYKVTIRLDTNDKKKVVGITVSLLDTLPVANSLNVSKLGMLFIPAEFGDHVLYQFVRINVEEDAPSCTSEECLAAFQSSGMNEVEYFNTINASKLVCKFTPTLLQNLRSVYTMESLAPTTGVLVGELAGNEVSPQIYTLNGRGPRSSLRTLRHGASVTELAISDLPGVPGAIYTIKDNSRDALNRKSDIDKFIVVSFADATLVLSVGESVEEVGKESGFITESPTLACAALANGCGIAQVHPKGVRHIRDGKESLKWENPGLKSFECASANESQIIVALSGGSLMYFELDPNIGVLTDKSPVDMGADISCLDVGTVQAGRSRSMFAAVGFRDQTVRILSLEPGKLFTQRSSTTLRARPYSVALQYMQTAGGVEEVILTIGLDDGSSVRTSVDPVTGSISTSPTGRFLGARAVSVSRISIDSSAATLLLSSRPWISRPDPKSGKHVMAPLSYAPLDHGCSFSSDAIKEGIVATSGTTLRILTVESDGACLGTEDEAFNSNQVDLRYTPRQMCLLAAGGQEEAKKLVLAVIESDYNDYSLAKKNAMGFDADGSGRSKKKVDGDGMDIDSDDEKEDDEEDEDEDDKNARATPIRGPVPDTPGHWASSIRVLDPSNGCSTLDCIELEENEAAFCCASVRFHSRGGEALLAVGTVSGMTMHPLKYPESHIAIYRVVRGEKLQLLHRTPVDDGPVLALAHFQGRLLAGIGQTLRLYEMGKKALLRKCELRGLPTMIKTLLGAGDRAYVGDLVQSMQFVRYDSSTNKLILVASDRVPRPITCQELLDMNTVAVGDKFGNISVLRLPRGADARAVDMSGTRALWDSSRDDATPRLETLCNYHVGEVVTGMTRASLVAGGSESLIYVTITGRIGALVPFTSRENFEFYTELEGCLRINAPRPTGREPQAYRSYYAPIKHVIDGDLCEMYGKLSYEEQKKIAEKIDRNVGEVIKKLEDTRNVLL